MTEHPTRTGLVWLARAINLVASLAAAAYSFSFGAKIGGPFLAVLLAINGGVLCSIFIGWCADRLLRPGGEPERPPTALR